MDDPRPMPWPGIALAVFACLGLVLGGGSMLAAALVALVWIGSLFIHRSGGSLTPAGVQAPAEQLFLSHDTMEAIVEHSAMPLIMLEDNRILIANRAARGVLGRHIIGQDVRVALRHPAAIELLDSGRDGSAVLRGLASRADAWGMNRKTLDENHALIELINRSTEEDVSRAHTDFVANASHELRTPLASIIGYAETLTDEGGMMGPDTTTRFSRNILREARRLKSLVDDLMSLSRIEAEKHHAPAERLAMAALAPRAARDAAGSEREGRLEVAMPDGECTILGDRQQIEQLVRNLVDNALKYGDPREPVTVSLAAIDGQRIELKVRDRGPGIAAEHLPHLTRRFYRTDPARSRAAGGTGLGLAIVKHIVERHRGILDIVSREGEGTTVSIRLPLADDDA